MENAIYIAGTPLPACSMPDPLVLPPPQIGLPSSTWASPYFSKEPTAEIGSPNWRNSRTSCLPGAFPSLTLLVSLFSLNQSLTTFPYFSFLSLLLPLVFLEKWRRLFEFFFGRGASRMRKRFHLLTGNPSPTVVGRRLEFQKSWLS